ncbi:MAG: tRNA (cytidine(56)-2'-O)-methyltransferase [Candidatus Micrarchaeota archaeon]|nr:tRNA (cytidine(56)-2'-O)-methyltransferase [Candidatus Micrarchaeota archaeon]
MAKVCILRLGHRRLRDQRITTHVFLTARALGATEGVLCGERDESVLRGIEKVSEVWGGKFPIRYEENWQLFIRKKKRDGWKIAHLTMYGIDFRRVLLKKKVDKCVVVVGAGKVPQEIYELADYNVSVTNQPHSEVAATALFLDRLFGGKELGKKFEGKIRIVPKACGKLVVHGKNSLRDINESD